MCGRKESGSDTPTCFPDGRVMMANRIRTSRGSALSRDVVEVTCLGWNRDSLVESTRASLVFRARSGVPNRSAMKRAAQEQDGRRPDWLASTNPRAESFGEKAAGLG